MGDGAKSPPPTAVSALRQTAVCRHAYYAGEPPPTGAIENPYETWFGEGTMTNKHEAERQFKGSAHDVRAAVRYALRRLSRKNVNWSQGRITFTVPMSWSSWGERVTIDLDGVGNVRVLSKCVWQLHDWGKSKRNVECILDWMEEYFELKAILQESREH